MKLYVKYMVSIRCKMVVQSELEKLDLHASRIELGEVETEETLSEAQLERLAKGLMKSGLELMEDKQAILILKIKGIIVEMVHYAEEQPQTNFSDYLSEKLNYNYTYLANTFSKATGITIEHFIILHKIERVKELLLYDELNLTQIAYLLNYSSVAHLSNQFKKVTGLTPSYFKQIKRHRDLNMLDSL